MGVFNSIQQDEKTKERQLYSSNKNVKNKKIKVPGKLIHTNIEEIIISKRIDVMINKSILIIIIVLETKIQKVSKPDTSIFHIHQRGDLILINLSLD